MGSHWISFDSDLVLHILYGRQMIAGGILESDPLLLGITEPPILQEWLFEIVVAWIESLIGLQGLVLVFAILLGSLLAGVFRRMRQQGVCLWVALVFLFVVILTLRVHLIIRPHLISWAAIFLLAAILHDWNVGKRSFLSTLLSGVIIMLFWANLHGGFLIGLVLTSLFVVDNCLNVSTRRGLEKFLQALFLFSAFGLITFLNPWGWHLHEHLASFLTSNLIIESTPDFFAPSWDNATLQILILVALAVIVPMLGSVRRISVGDWLLFIGLLYAAATSVRNIPFFGLLMLPIAAVQLQQIIMKSSRPLPRLILESSQRLEHDQGNNNGIGWPIMVVGIMVGLFLTGVIRVGLTSINVPAGALQWINAQPSLNQQPVFADSLFAGFVLFGTPTERVYLHSLTANYPHYLVEDYLRVARGENGWEEIVAKFNWAIVKTDRAHARTFSKSFCWRLVYSDSQATVFERVCGLNR